jgi:hypothetical protein
LMVTMRLSLIVLLSAMACASGAKDARSGGAATGPAEAYYAGDFVVASPDGATPFGPAKTSVVKRVVDAEHHTITEDVRQGSERFLTTLTQIPGTPRFAAADAGKTFNGEVTFQGDPWGASTWSYAIAMTDRSGTLIGAGRLSAAGITTRKEFRDASGQPRAVIVEDLKTISRDEYDRLIAEAAH